MRTCSALSWLAMFLAVLGAVPAQAEVRQMPWEASPPPRLVEDRLRVEVGLWQAGISTQLRADATPTQPGTTLNGEADLGLDDRRLMTDVELTLLPGRRQVLRLNGFSARRSSSAVLNRTVQFDGNNYFVGDVVRSTLNLDMVGLGYAYRLFKAPRYELDVGLDIQIAAVEANVFVPRRAAREADDGVLPIPMLDLEGRVEIFRNWQLLARYRSCCLGLADTPDVSGAMTDWRVGVQWQFNPHLGVGLHYRNFGIHVDAASGSHPGAIRLDHTGPELVFRASL